MLKSCTKGEKICSSGATEEEEGEAWARLDQDKQSIPEKTDYLSSVMNGEAWSWLVFPCVSSPSPLGPHQRTPGMNHFPWRNGIPN